ncbi:hypothetical protein [Nocardia brasiliensis]|uniref:hypothetical protein n=1 Tax=Nocardia brasiliensis TaxID=37326 RepID=UPI003D949949
MTPSEDESLSFRPAEPPPFPDARPIRKTVSRRKIAALAGALPLGAIGIGALLQGRNSENVSSAAVPGPASTSPTPTTSSTLTTRAAPAADLAPEISRIGSRHIAALHAIHNYMNHISTYTPHSLDEYFTGAIDSSTGAHRKHLIDTQHATREYLLATNRRSQVLDFNCGLRAITGGNALGVGYVKLATTNDSAAEQSVSLTAMVVTAEEQPDSRWLISDVKQIST